MCMLAGEDFGFDSFLVHVHCDQKRTRRKYALIATTVTKCLSGEGSGMVQKSYGRFPDLRTKRKQGLTAYLGLVQVQYVSRSDVNLHMLLRGRWQHSTMTIKSTEIFKYVVNLLIRGIAMKGTPIYHYAW
jgi:hypothetical protein